MEENQTATALAETAEQAAGNTSEGEKILTTSTVQPEKAGDGENSASQKMPRRKRAKRRKKKIYEITSENDIWFRGPLSYRHLRMLAWFFFLLTQVGTILALAAKLDGSVERAVGVLPNVLKATYSIMMPLFLIATFATIINGSRTFKSMLIFYGGTCLAIFLAYVMVIKRYMPSALSFVTGEDKGAATNMVETLVGAFGYGGFFAFNVFVDLFLCTLLAFFVLYRPKKLKGKKLKAFRYLALIPVLYEAACLVLKFLSALEFVRLPVVAYGLLTTKPPMTFIVFLLIVLFLKKREKKYFKVGKSANDYDDFVQTNVNSWHFSRFTAVTMLLASVIDLVLMIVLSVLVSGLHGGVDDIEADLNSLMIMAALLKAGVGGSIGLFFAAPFVFLFSYTRTYKDTKFDMLLPFIAIGLLVLLYCEALAIGSALLPSLPTVLGG